MRSILKLFSMAALRRTVMMFTLFAVLSGCELGEVVESLDEAIGSIDHAVFQTTVLGKDLKSEIAKLPVSLRKEAAHLLAFDASNIVAKGGGTAQISAFAIMDYANKKILANLRALSVGLKEERDRIAKGGRFDGTIEALISKVVAAVEISLDPVVTISAPDSVTILRKSDGTSALKFGNTQEAGLATALTHQELFPVDNLIRYYGYGLRHAKAQFTAHLQASGSKGEGEVLLDLSSSLNVQGDYMLVLSVQELMRVNNASLNGSRIVLRSSQGNVKHEIPVLLRIEAPEPPPPSPTVYRIVIDRIHCTQADWFWDDRGEPKVSIAIDGGSETTIFRKYVSEGKSRSIGWEFTAKDSFALTVVEEDSPDGNDHLGTKVFKVSEFYKGQAVFKEKGEKFTVTWRVVAP